MLGLLAPAPHGQFRARLAHGHDGPPELSWQLSLPGVGDLWFPVQFCRGFVDGIRLTMTDFLKHAEAIFSAHPVTQAVLTDRKPNWARNNFVWNLIDDYSDPDVLRFDCHPPHALHRQKTGLRFFHKRKYADLYLSGLCVSFGRDAAGLHPLTAPPPASGIPGRSGT